MVGKKEKGEYTLSQEELQSTEMVFITLSMLESRGYPGLMELMSLFDDPTTIIKFMRLFYGMTIRIPNLKEFVDCLRAAEYAFCDMHKKINDNLVCKPLDIRNHMKISQEEEKHLLEIFDDWIKYMHDNGRDVLNYMHCNRNNTKKRIQMVQNGKKWTREKY